MPAKGKNLTQLFSKHDVDTVYPERIRACLEEMAKENVESWEYETDFFRRAGVQPARAVKYRDKFAKHIAHVPTELGTGRDPRIVYCGSPKTAARIRAKFKLSASRTE
jgi:hypothetical protein